MILDMKLLIRIHIGIAIAMCLLEQKIKTLYSA